MMKAQVAARAKDIAGAEAAVDRALAVAPRDPDALTMKASLLAARGQRDEAIKLLQQSIASDPAAVGTRFALVSMMITQGKVKEAEPLIEGLKKDAPKDFRTRYAEALLALSKGQSAQARDIVQPLLAARPDHPATLFIAALANYDLGNYALAEDAARKVVSQVPTDPAPRRLLASTYLKTGRSAQAVEVAEEGLARIPDDPGLLRLAGEARMSAGQVAEAARHFERAAATEKQGSTARLRLAEVRLATGDTGRAMADLEQLSKADSSQIQADLALAAAHLRRREFDKALAAIAAIEKKQPNTALPQELQGTVYAAKRDYPNARKHLGRALELEPARLSAARALAIIDLQEGKVADARARYDKIIALEPKNERPLLAMAELLAVSGAPPAEVRTVLERAIAVNPAAPTPHLALVQQLRRIGDNKGAMEAARAAVAALPNEAALLETLGALEVQQGEVAQARETFNKLARLQPSNPMPLLRLSETYVANRDFTTALDLQRKALALQPDNTTTLVTLATTQLIAGKPDEAIAEARRLQKERPNAAVGYLLESELLAAQKKPAEAAGRHEGGPRARADRRVRRPHLRAAGAGRQAGGRQGPRSALGQGPSRRRHVPQSPRPVPAVDERPGRRGGRVQGGARDRARQCRRAQQPRVAPERAQPPGSARVRGARLPARAAQRQHRRHVWRHPGEARRHQAGAGDAADRDAPRAGRSAPADQPRPHPRCHRRQGGRQARARGRDCGRRALARAGRGREDAARALIPSTLLQPAGPGPAPRP